MADWIEATETQAYALNIKPAEYENLQPQELRKIFNGYKNKQKDADYRKAYFLSWLVNVQVTEQVTPEKIADPLWITQNEKENQKLQDRDVLFKEFNIDNNEQG